MLACLATLAACQAAPPATDEVRARAHIERLAGTIGSRPLGTPAHALAREYIVQQLTGAGLRVRLQQVEATDPARGLTVPVTNVIAWRDGSVKDAIALVSHYDSVPDGPGALDDALGVAICLEAARALFSTGLRQSLVVVVTDAEEVGLMGARAAVLDPEIASRVRAFINFDGTGAAGPAFLFEAGPGWGAPLSSWARGAPAPAGASFASEIYERLPNDTDFTIFKTIASGLNFAPVRDSYAYHTNRDVPARIEPFTVRHQLANAVAIVRAIDRTEPRQRDATPTFFDVAGLRAVVYGPGVAALIAWSACALGAIAWLRLLLRLQRMKRGIAALLLTLVWALFRAIVVGGAVVGAAWALRVVRGQLNPWYASPIVVLMWLTAAGAVAVVAAHRLAMVVPERWRPRKGSTAVWWVTLLPWIAMTITAQLLAPTASYLTAFPLAAASLGLIVAADRTTAVRVVSAVVLGIAAVLSSMTVLLFEFVANLFGRLPIVAPVWLLPALVLFAGLLIVPPALAAVAGWRPGLVPRFAAPVALAAAMISGVAALRAPAFTEERPQLRAARYVQDDVKGEAWWEVGGMEPGLGLEGATLPGAAWQRVTGAPSTTVRSGTLGTAFVHRTAVPVAGTAPSRVAVSRTVNPDGTVTVSTHVTTLDTATIRLVLPRGIVPVAASPAGVVTGGQYAVTYVAPPSSGVLLRVTVVAADEAALAGAVLVTSIAGLPGGQGLWKLPDWLPEDKAAWRARSVYITRVDAPRQLAPVSMRTGYSR